MEHMYKRFLEKLREILTKICSAYSTAWHWDEQSIFNQRGFIIQGIYHTSIIQEQMLREISDWDRLAIYTWGQKRSVFRYEWILVCSIGSNYFENLVFSDIWRRQHLILRYITKSFFSTFAFIGCARSKKQHGDGFYVSILGQNVKIYSPQSETKRNRV
jgi:hypothetical protein